MLSAFRSIPLLLVNYLLESLLIESILIFLSFNSLLDCALIGEHLFIELLLSVMHVLRIELPLLPDYLQPPVHVPELEMRSRVRTDVPVLVNSGAQDDPLAEKLCNLRVSHRLCYSYCMFFEYFLLAF